MADIPTTIGNIAGGEDRLKFYRERIKRKRFLRRGERDFS